MASLTEHRILTQKRHLHDASKSRLYDAYLVHLVFGRLANGSISGFTN